MTLNNGVRVQHEIPRRTGLLSISNCIRRNTESYYKERNEKGDTTISRNKTNNKKGHARKLYTRISKETMNIPGRQEQKKE